MATLITLFVKLPKTDLPRNDLPESGRRASGDTCCESPFCHKKSLPGIALRIVSLIEPMTCI
ncbi:MAG: hypothetical protein AB7V39_12880, partial [Nitrospiraceae bacterium]